MPWSKTKTIPAMENKSDYLKGVFAEAANSALNKGQSEEDSIFAGLAAVKLAEKKSKPKVEKAVTEIKLPSHVTAILEKQKQLKEEVINKVQGRNLIKADFDNSNRLVLTFDNGDKLTTRPVEVNAISENYISVSPSNSSSSGGTYQQYEITLSGYVFSFANPSQNSYPNVRVFKNGSLKEVQYDFDSSSNTIILSSNIELTGCLAIVN